MAEFDNQDIYNKHQSSCEEGDCGCNSKDDCGCCPPGLVAVKDCDGNISCLTPNDAACFKVNSHIPVEGYVKLYDPISGEYLGDVTSQEALNYISAIDPNVNPPATAGVFNPITIDSIDIALPGPANTAVEFAVDRISCEEAIAITLLNPPAGFSFLGGGTSINIAAGSSEIDNAIEIDGAVLAGAYNVTVQYTGCGNSYTKVITVNVS